MSFVIHWNPLISYQRRHSVVLQQLNVPFFPDVSLLQNPEQSYVNFLRVLTQNLLVAPVSVPDVSDLNSLQEAADSFRQGERFIYSTIVQTLKVGDTMFVNTTLVLIKFCFAQTIINDNHQVTTRSLMIVFSALLSLSLRDNETVCVGRVLA